MLSLLLGYLGASWQMTEECLKKLLVSSSCVCITPVVLKKGVSCEVLSSQTRRQTRTPSCDLYLSSWPRFMSSTATPDDIALTSAAFSAISGDMASRSSLTSVYTDHPTTYTSCCALSTARHRSSQHRPAGGSPSSSPAATCASWYSLTSHPRRGGKYAGTPSRQRRVAAGTKVAETQMAELGLGVPRPSGRKRSSQRESTGLSAAARISWAERDATPMRSEPKGSASLTWNRTWEAKWASGTTTRADHSGASALRTTCVRASVTSGGPGTTTAA
jgi:hypothetical protein